MTQLFLVSTLHAAVTLAAAIDDGLVPASGSGERVLLAANTTVAPELTDAWHTLPAAQPVLSRFDRVVFLNESLHPFHPREWAPSDESLPLLNRALRSHWELGEGPLDLVVESLHAAPAATLVRIFHQEPVSVLSAGLAGYGPTRYGQPLMVAQRLDRLYYLDILDGIGPLLLREAHIDLVPVSIDSYRRVIGQMVEAAPQTGSGRLPNLSDRPTTLVLGQSLSALGILSAEEEVALTVSAIEAAFDSGVERVAFKPDQASTPALNQLLRNEVAKRGFDLVELPDAYPAEMIASVSQLHSAVSCFSTALLVLRAAYGVAATSVGTELLFERLSPYQDGNRIPVTIVHALTREPDRYSDPDELRRLIETVAYCMQPNTCANLRPVAQQVLTDMNPDKRRLYVKRRRLISMNLPGSDPVEGPRAPGPAPRRSLGTWLRGLGD